MPAPLRPFFTYFGGKYRAAVHYPPPDRGSIVEPFAGSAGYSLRYPHLAVTLIERDECVAATWRYLLTATPRQIRALPLIGDGWETTDDLRGLDRGAINLIGFWLSKATAAPRRRPSAWAVNRPDVGYWGAEIRERVARQVESIRHWRLLEGDYTLAPDVRATWFVDPPYISAGHQYRHGSQGIDYTALASWCRQRRGQVIVCEAAGADWLPFESVASVRVQRGYSHEVAWMQCG